jgi:16S rRNA (guanine1207-N2)-methyltransferase
VAVFKHWISGRDRFFVSEFAIDLKCSQKTAVTAALETLMLVFTGDNSLPAPPRALFLGAQPHPELARWPSICGWQPQKPLAAAWDAAGFDRCEDLTAEKWPLILILPGKSKDETLAGFSAAKDRLSAGGKIVVAMPNTAGASRFEKELEKAAGSLVSLQKHKCRAFYTSLEHPDEALFSIWRQLGEPREISGFTVQAGIFSSDHIDPGSQFLADHLPANLHGTIADLGAGWGFLSAAVLDRNPQIKRLDLYEADARALNCARLNLAARQQQISYHWHDVTTGLAEVYDAIIMNPPFHTGQATDVDLGRAFLGAGTRALKRGGKLLLVANRQLPYEAVLTTSGLHWRKIAENRIYKILFAEKR